MTKTQTDKPKLWKPSKLFLCNMLKAKSHEKKEKNCRKGSRTYESHNSTIKGHPIFKFAIKKDMNTHRMEVTRIKALFIVSASHSKEKIDEQLKI